uniref:Uncharacterized protein n=1 Tax=Lactuca sativa TaxID=4236 RepID=A0A9R1UQK3_LACSA|nr:hypothetical protein LSAT_V11C800447950 [Lactuca sativa]
MYSQETSRQGFVKWIILTNRRVVINLDFRKPLYAMNIGVLAMPKNGIGLFLDVCFAYIEAKSLGNQINNGVLRKTINEIELNVGLFAPCPSWSNGRLAILGLKPQAYQHWMHAQGLTLVGQLSIGFKPLHIYSYIEWQVDELENAISEVTRDLAKYGIDQPKL